MDPMNLDQFTSDFFLRPEAFDPQATHEAFVKDPLKIVDNLIKSFVDYKVPISEKQIKSDLNTHLHLRELVSTLTTLISTTDSAVRHLAKTILVYRDLKSQWILRYALFQRDLADLLLPELHHYFVRKFMKNGHVMIPDDPKQDAAKLLQHDQEYAYFCSSLNFVLNLEPSQNELHFVAVAESVTDLIDAYAEGIMHPEVGAVPQAAYCRNILAYLLGLVYSKPRLIQRTGPLILRHLDSKQVATMFALDRFHGFSLYCSNGSLRALSEKVSLWPLLFSESSLPFYSLFLGEVILFLDEIQFSLASESLNRIDGLSTKELGACFMTATHFILNMTQVNAATLNDSVSKWMPSFKRCLPAFVEAWWSRLVSSADSVKIIEKCLLMLGTLDTIDTTKLICKTLILSPQGFTDSRTSQPFLMDLFIASWMHLLKTFECRFPGCEAECLKHALDSLDDDIEEDILVSALIIFHLTIQFEPKCSFQDGLCMLSETENWERILAFGFNRQNLAAFQLALHILPHCRLSFGSVYSIIEKIIEKMFTYCKDFNQEINQARDQVLLDILLKICINYDSAEILVDTILDEFVSVFDKGIIDSPQFNAARATVSFLLDECVRQELIKPVEIARQVSNRFLPFLVRDISKIKRLHIEPVALREFEKAPIVWELLLTACTDAEARRFVIYFIQPQVSIITEWWGTPGRKNARATKYPYLLYATSSALRIYSKSLCVPEPENMVFILLSKLNGNEIHILMSNYCAYVESYFGLVNVGQRDEWYSHRISFPLSQSVKEWLLEGRITEDEAGFFLKIIEHESSSTRRDQFS